ncbi:MAG: ABC transporter permease [Clostridiales Family XIII bacterium]|jgi:ABC-type antimicrobial peptide transport system permease subunit|nr:ABC transporter permease [Clostridiales Family XIII bacterium]
MNNRDIVSLSIRNLLRRKTRSILAVTGVIIGICAIVAMLSIGFGLQEGFRESLERWGNLHLVTVFPTGGYGSMGMVYYDYGGGGSGSQDNKQVKLDNKAIGMIEGINGVSGVTPREDAYLTFGIGKYVAGMSVVGVRPEVLEKFNYEVDDGRNMRAGDKNVVVFGNQTTSYFYNPKKSWGSSYSGEPVVDVITDKIVVTPDWSYGQPQANQPDEENRTEYKEYTFKGIGVLGGPDNYDTAYYAYMPIDVLQKIREEQAKAEKQRYDKSSYSQAMVYVDDIENVKAVSEAIREMGFQTNSLNDALETMQAQARTIQTILGGIGAISLLVAALGITNTMIMSIYERTKEIGVMKVIGANLPDIRKLFLIEAGIIGFVGGILGIGLSYLLSLVMNTALLPVISSMIGGSGGSKISIIPLWLPLAALGFSTVIGVLSGYSPARRAMNLSALESLRNE